VNNASHENRHEIRPANGPVPAPAASPGERTERTERTGAADAAPAHPAAPPGGTTPAARAARRAIPRALVAAVLAGGAAVSVAAQDEGARHPAPEAAPPVQRAYAARPVAVGASTRGATRRRTRAQGPAALGHGMAFPGRRRAGAHPGAVTGAEASRLLGVRSAPAVRSVPGPFAGPVDGPGGGPDAPADAPTAPQAPDGSLLGRLNGALGGELGDLGAGPLFGGPGAPGAPGGPGGPANGGDQGGPAPDPDPAPEQDNPGPEPAPGPDAPAQPGRPAGAADGGQGPASPAPGTPAPDGDAPAPGATPPAGQGPSAPPASPTAPASPAGPPAPAPHKPPHHAPAPSGADKLDWDGLAQCEAGGRPDAVDPSGRYGGLYQFDAHTWHSLGGSGLPQDAPADRQTALAKKLYQRRGASPWPSCGRRLYR
jgi:hypothetical protein